MLQPHLPFCSCCCSTSLRIELQPRLPFCSCCCSTSPSIILQPCLPFCSCCCPAFLLHFDHVYHFVLVVVELPFLLYFNHIYLCFWFSHFSFCCLTFLLIILQRVEQELKIPVSPNERNSSEKGKKRNRNQVKFSLERIHHILKYVDNTRHIALTFERDERTFRNKNQKKQTERGKDISVPTKWRRQQFTTIAS